MMDDIRDDYRDALLAESQMHNAAERATTIALVYAIQFHCRGELVPEDVACRCREQAVNLDRELKRSRGEDPGPMPCAAILRDYTQVSDL